MSASVLLLGFMLGMRHALEGDHLAAMASILTKSDTKICAAKQGIAWGVGHTLTLLIFGLLAISLNIRILEQYSMFLEMAVGIMLIVLGLNVINQLIKRKIHVHRHDHENGQTHIHFHSHVNEDTDAQDIHNHFHTKNFPYSALSMGILHGLAGTASLIIIAISSTASPMMVLQYMLLFGIGSTLGMGVLSVIIAISFNVVMDKSKILYHYVVCIAGIVTVVTGGYIIYKIGFNQGYLLVSV